MGLIIDTCLVPQAGQVCVKNIIFLSHGEHCFQIFHSLSVTCEESSWLVAWYLRLVNLGNIISSVYRMGAGV